MSNLGQVAFTLVGTVVGAVSGNPALGFAIGSALGNALFPSRPKSPSVLDGHVSGASEGTPIPYVIGSYRVAGNVISHGPFKQHDSGGKGGGPSTTTTTISFRLSVCDNQDGLKIGVRRIWADGGLVYDVSESASTQVLAASKQLASKMTVYLGGPTQMPDPTEESIFGAGMVTPHRGYFDIVFNDIDVTQYGSRIPNIEVEVIEGSAIDKPDGPFKSEVLFPWVNENDPRNCKNDHEYQALVSGATWGSFSDAVAAWVAYGVANSLDYLDANSFDNYISWALDTSSDIWALSGFLPEEREVLYLHFNRYAPNVPIGSGSPIFIGYIDNAAAAGSALACSPLYFDGVPADGLFRWWTGTADHGYTNEAGIYRVAYGRYATPLPGENFGNYCAVTGEYAPGGPGFDPDTPYPTAYASPDFIIKVRRKARAPDNPCAPRCSTSYPLLPGDSTHCVIGGDITANLPYEAISAPSGHHFAWLTDYHLNGGTPSLVDCYPLGPVLYDSDPHYADETWWDAAYLAALDAYPGELPSGMTYLPVTVADGLHYPIIKTYAYHQVAPNLPNLRPVPVAVGDALTRISERAGIATGDIDVSSVTSTIAGMAVVKAGATGRDMATPLMQYGFIDAYDNGAKLVFAQRGGAAVATLTEDDLGAFEAGSGSSDSRLPILRANDYELPRDTRVHFTNTLNAYQDGLQLAPRQIAQGLGQSDIDLGIACTPTQARKVAEVLSRLAWLGRETGRIAVSASWLTLLRPGAAFNLSAGGITRRYLVQNPNYQFPGLLTLDIIRDEQNLYETLVAAGDGTESAATTVPPTVLPPTALIVLDLPALQSGDEIDAGVYVAAYPVLTPWPGAAIYESKDGGGSYAVRAVATSACAVGTMRTGLPTGSPTVIDTTTTLVVDMLSGTLAGVTDEAITGGANSFAIGAPGRWTIIQARDVTLNMDGSYTLTGFYQGLKNTLVNRGTSIAGDSIVQLDARLRRVHESVDEIGQTRLLRAVTGGSALGDATDVSFTVTGLSYVPSLTGSAPAHAIIIGGGTAPAGSPTTSIAPTLAGNVLIDQGPSADPAYKTISGDGTLSAAGALTVTKTNGVDFTDSAITPLDTDNTLSANSDGKIATQKAVKGYVDGKVTGVLRFKGATDCSANPNYPSAALGDAYVVSVAGKIGGASGLSVDVGDVYAASAANAGGTQAAVGSSWFILEHNLVGALLSANNLSDLASVSTARSNLGLGSLAQQNTTLNLALNYAPPVTLASASTVNIGAATSNEIIITGTTPITAFDTIAAGAKREITFSGALILTHNATSLILPGAANITTAAGDVASMLSLGAGNWRCTAFSKANGQAVASTSAFTFLRGADFFNDGLVLVASDADIPVIDVPVNCTITGWRILTQGGPGSCSFDVWKSTYGAYPPVVGGSIVAGNYPAVSSASKATDTTLSGWTTSLTAGDVLAIQLRSSSTLTRCVLLLTLST